MDKSMNQKPGSFPVDRPVEALLRDHDMARTLIEAYRNGESDAARINAAEQICMLLETHALLEEGVFYPAVSDVDPDLVEHFQQDHQKTDELLVQLKRSSLNAREAWPVLEQLIEMTMQHIEEEETQFFPKLEKANMDMTAIGLQMQAYEANLVHIQAQATQREARR